MMLDEVRRQADDFDIIHFHNDLIHFPLLPTLNRPSVTTLHGRLDIPDLKPFYARFCEAPLVAISNSQRSFLPQGNFVATIHHGLRKDSLSFNPVAKGGYFAFLGRISPEKRPDRAIEIAARTGVPLKIAAKIDRADREYWEEVIRPMVANNPNVEYIGEINERQKSEFLGNALALLFPIDWPEPFGIVMIEAMACGTPVLAFRCGSVPEVIDEGVTGYIVDSVDDAVAVVGDLLRLDRMVVRRRFEERFTAERMTRAYVETYRRLITFSDEPMLIQDTTLIRRASREISLTSWHELRTCQTLHLFCRGRGEAALIYRYINGLSRAAPPNIEARRHVRRAWANGDIKSEMRRSRASIIGIRGTSRISPSV